MKKLIELKNKSKKSNLELEKGLQKYQEEKIQNEMKMNETRSNPRASISQFVKINKGKGPSKLR